MRLIADEVKLKKDVQAKQIVDLLSREFIDDNVYVYYKYPIYRGDLAEDLVQAQLLFTSPDYGVVYILCRIGDPLLPEDYAYIENLDSNIFKKFISRPELREGKRNLKFNIKGIVTSTETECRADIQFVKLDDLVHEIKLNRQAPSLTDEEYSILVSCIDNTTKMTVKKQRKIIAGVDGTKTKSEIIDIIQQKETCFDYEQRRVAMNCIDSPQRIRGLAGSGKTILLTMKAALYHLANPDAEILYTYYTKDLYDLIRRLIERFYREAADNHEPNWKKIHIYHAWGGYELEGVYSSTCESLSIEPIPYKTARIYNSHIPFAYVCNTLLDKGVKERYDLTLIDEGQDFPNEFYQLCYKLTKNRRIVWAYDEFQNIFDVNLQDEKETFGTDINGRYYVDFQRDKNPNQDIILHCCYRTPRNVLIGAFSLGLGVYSGKVLQRLDSNKVWESLGFSVEQGNCQDGDSMIISRPVENTPSVVNEQFEHYSMSWYAYNTMEDECDGVAKLIYDDIHEEGLLADDICVICLDTRNISKYYSNISSLLNSKGVRTFNMLTAPNSNKRFSFEGFVTLATLNKAKGNETGMVYIIGADSIFKNPTNVILRNRLFTAITRAKGWVALSGVGEDSMSRCYDELQALKDHDMKLEFVQPSKMETKTVMQESKHQSDAFDAISQKWDELLKLGYTQEEIISVLNKK